jgi:hypothetical protein
VNADMITGRRVDLIVTGRQGYLLYDFDAMRLAELVFVPTWRRVLAAGCRYGATRASPCRSHTDHPGASPAHTSTQTRTTVSHTIRNRQLPTSACLPGSLISTVVRVSKTISHQHTHI